MPGRKVVTIIRTKGEPDHVEVMRQGVPVPAEKPTMKLTPVSPVEESYPINRKNIRSKKVRSLK